MVKMGASHTQNTDNYQSTFNTAQDGSLGFASGQAANVFTKNQLGSSNRVANFTMGILSSYTENNSSPIADTAYQQQRFLYPITGKRQNA